MGLPAAAQCSISQPVDVEAGVLEADNHKDDHHDHHEEHSEFEVKYKFNCKNASALNQVEVKAFSKFKGMRRLKAQAVTDKGQMSQTLTKKSPVLKLK